MTPDTSAYDYTVLFDWRYLMAWKQSAAPDCGYVTMQIAFWRFYCQFTIGRSW